MLNDFEIEGIKFVVLVKLMPYGVHRDQSVGVSANRDISITNSYYKNFHQKHFLRSGNGDAVIDEKDAEKVEEKKDEEKKNQCKQNLLKCFLLACDSFLWASSCFFSVLFLFSSMMILLNWRQRLIFSFFIRSGPVLNDLLVNLTFLKIPSLMVFDFCSNFFYYIYFHIFFYFLLFFPELLINFIIRKVSNKVFVSKYFRKVNNLKIIKIQI